VQCLRIITEELHFVYGLENERKNPGFVHQTLFMDESYFIGEEIFNIHNFSHV